MNECPVDGCPKRIPRTMLMCKGHWFMVPADKRNTVWRTYRGGAGGPSGTQR